jgi:hypothetical protein
MLAAPAAPPAFTGAAALLFALGERLMSLAGPLSTVPAPPLPSALVGLLAPVACTMPLEPALGAGLLPENGATVAPGEESSL